MRKCAAMNAASSAFSWNLLRRKNETSISIERGEHDVTLLFSDEWKSRVHEFTSTCVVMLLRFSRSEYKFRATRTGRLTVVDMVQLRNRWILQPFCESRWSRLPASLAIPSVLPAG